MPSRAMVIGSMINRSPLQKSRPIFGPNPMRSHTISRTSRVGTFFPVKLGHSGSQTVLYQPDERQMASTPLDNEMDHAERSNQGSHLSFLPTPIGSVPMPLPGVNNVALAGSGCTSS